MADRLSGFSANPLSWIDRHDTISMEPLTPSTSAAPAHEKATLATKVDPNPSLTARLPTPSTPNASPSTLPQVREQMTTTNEPSASKPPPPRTIHGIAWAIAVLAILSSVFLFSLDQTIVADVQPAIVSHFGAVEKLPWLSVSIMLGASASNLFWGKMYTQFNPKWLYICTVALFELGSAICGAAPSMDALIVGRTIAGVGGAGMYLGVIVLLSFSTSPVERPRYIGYTGVTFGLGTVLGPIIGGAFTDSAATWRWAFYINLCIGGLFGPVYIFMVPGRDPQPGKSFFARMAEIDWVGNTLITGVFVSGLMAINCGGITYPWNSGQTIGLFCCSVVLLAVLGVQQGLIVFTTKQRRMFPVQYLRLKEMLILFAVTAAAGTSSFVTMYFVPLYFQFAKHDSALTAGVNLLPYIVPLVTFTMLQGIFMGKVGYYMPWFLVGGVFMLVSNVMLYRITLDINSGYVFGAEVLGGIGTGLFVNAPFSVSQWILPPQDIPAAAGFIMCARVGGIGLALAMANSIFLNLAENAISHVLPTASKTQVQSLVSGVGSSLIDTLDVNTQREVLNAIVNALRKGFSLGITAGALAITLSVFMDRKKVVLKPPPNPKADKGGASA